MSENKNYTDSQRVSSKETGQISECPTCQSPNQEQISCVPHTVCSDCGLVIGTDADIPTSQGDMSDSGSMESESWNEYYSVTNSTEQQVADALQHIETLGEELYLSTKSRKLIAEVYADAACENATDGRPSIITVAAALCIGSRESESPRPGERVAEVADIDERQLRQTIRTFQEELNRGFTEVSPAMYVSYMCKEGGLSKKVGEEAARLIKRYEASNSQAGTHPAGIAAAAIYCVPEATVTQREIAAVAGITKETVRVRLNELREVTE